MNCKSCGAELVEVDNPFRKEFRHKRGTECNPQIVAPTAGAAFIDDRMIIDNTSTNTPVKWADVAMYRSEPPPNANRAPGGGTRPTVTLLNATPDPLGSLAALCGIYKGEVVRGLRMVTDDERRQALADMGATVLNGPLEVINFHFLVEGVTRAFTHQAVRNRFSFEAQESMRFAVVEGADNRWVDRCAYPPGLAAAPVGNSEILRRHLADNDGVPDRTFSVSDHMTPEERDYALRRDAWDDAIITAQQSYQRLIDAGVPAEDARGLMPHAMTTRYHWVVSLRTLLTEAGKRLCTQAQFEWRTVMAEVARSIRGYHSGGPIGEDSGGYCDAEHDADAWQFEAMADLLKPVCYQEGRCGFMAQFDRGCKIRDRVNANAAAGRPSSEWEGPLGGRLNSDMTDPGSFIPAIHPEEWLLDPGAAR